MANVPLIQKSKSLRITTVAFLATSAAKRHDNKIRQVYAIGVCCILSLQTVEAQKPNIVYITCDDPGYGAGHHLRKI